MEHLSANPSVSKKKYIEIWSSGADHFQPLPDFYHFYHIIISTYIYYYKCNYNNLQQQFIIIYLMCQKIDRKNVEKRGTKREKPLWKLQNFASEVHQSAKLWAESCPHVTKIACRLRNDSETTQTLSLQLRNSSLHIFAISLKKNLCLYH